MRYGLYSPPRITQNVYWLSAIAAQDSQTDWNDLNRVVKY